MVHWWTCEGWQCQCYQDSEASTLGAAREENLPVSFPIQLLAFYAAVRHTVAASVHVFLASLPQAVHVWYHYLMMVLSQTFDLSREGEGERGKKTRGENCWKILNIEHEKQK